MEAANDLPYVWAVMIGLTLVSAINRSFFFISRREVPLPALLQRGLRYAPLAALAAVIAPDVVMTHGHLIETWCDARLFGAASATAYFVWRRGMLGTIVVGTAVTVALRLTLGW
jgi:branched-subunit amino acid transport protein